MTYDRIADAIGLFELSEYLGLVTIYGALAITTPFLASGAASSTDRLRHHPCLGLERASQVPRPPVAKIL